MASTGQSNSLIQKITLADTIKLAVAEMRHNINSVATP